jgi:hypothetical protein
MLLLAAWHTWSAAALDLASLLPRSGAAPGWRTQGKPAAYTRANLYDYIDGGADFYLSYAFQRAVVADYSGPGHAKITVELYDMGSSYDAFGVFAHDQRPAAPSAVEGAKESPSLGQARDRGIGQGSSYTGGLLTLWKDRVFARVFAERESPATREAVLKFGKAIAAAVRAAGPKPPLLRLLPQAGLAPRSVRYLHTDTVLNNVLYLPGNPLGLNAQTDVVYGEYPGAKGVPPAKVVVVQYPTTERARAAFLAVGKLLGGSGVLHVTQMSFHQTERYRSVGAVTLGRWVGLAANAPDSATARRLIDAVTAGLKKRGAERRRDGGGA